MISFFRGDNVIIQECWSASDNILLIGLCIPFHEENWAVLEFNFEITYDSMDQYNEDEVDIDSNKIYRTLSEIGFTQTQCESIGYIDLEIVETNYDENVVRGILRLGNYYEKLVIPDMFESYVKHMGFDEGDSFEYEDCLTWYNTSTLSSNAKIISDHIEVNQVNEEVEIRRVMVHADSRWSFVEFNNLEPTIKNLLSEEAQNQLNNEDPVYLAKQEAFIHEKWGFLGDIKWN